MEKEKILSAKEFILSKRNPQAGSCREEIDTDLAIESMIEFAKLHVKAAIKACIEDAPSGSSTDTVSYEDVVEALKESYPLENIK